MITGANIRDIKKSQAGCKCLTKGGGKVRCTGKKNPYTLKSLIKSIINCIITGQLYFYNINLIILAEQITE